MRRFFLATLTVALTSSCVQMPTERHANVDLRPQLSFSVGNAALNPVSMAVYVDGLHVGQVGSYLTGQQGVRILSGTHTVKVVNDGVVLLDERIYVGDGMTKVIVVN